MGKRKLKNQNKSNPQEMYFLLASMVLVMPLIISFKTLDPNLAPRLFFLGVSILILSVFSLKKIAKNKSQFNFIRLTIFPIYALYFLLSVFSLTQAVNPAEGLFDITKTLLSFLLLFLASRIFITYKNATDLLIKGGIISTVVATSIGLFQYFTTIPGNSESMVLEALYEVRGLMSHKNQYAISLFLMLPFTIFGIFRMNSWWKALSIYSTFIVLLTITILQTRSVWLATLALLSGILISWLIISIRKRKIRIIRSKKTLIIIALVLIVAVQGSIFIIKKTGTQDLFRYQISTLTDTDSDNNQGRIKIWQATWLLAQDNLALGVGPGNWKISVLPYYNLNHGEHYKNWRRPHNDYLWVLAEKGIPGLISYLLIFIIISYYGIKILIHEKEKGTILFTSLLVSVIAGYMIIAFFTFPLERINHQVFLTLIMAVIISLYHNVNPTHRDSGMKYYPQLQKAVIILIIPAVLYSAIFLRSEFYSYKLFNAKRSKNWKMAVVFADKASTRFTTMDAFSVPFLLSKGSANYHLGKKDQAQRDFSAAFKYFPTSISISNNLGAVAGALGDNTQAIIHFRHSLEIFPHYDFSLFNLSFTYYKQEDYEKAYITLLNCDPTKRTKNHVELMNKLEGIINNPNQ